MTPLTLSHGAVPSHAASRRTQRAMALLVGLALVALAAGALIYVYARPPGTAALLPTALERSGTVAGAPHPGSAGITAWLPSFVHTWAFSVLTAWCLPWHARWAAAACTAWALLDTAAEVGQHPAIAPGLAEAIGRTFGSGGSATTLARYFANGTFDPADLWAGLAGSAVAFAALWLALRPARSPSSLGSAEGLPKMSVDRPDTPLKPSDRKERREAL